MSRSIQVGEANGYAQDFWTCLLSSTHQSTSGYSIGYTVTACQDQHQHKSTASSISTMLS
ncbi:uncharacterized protein DS421_16g550610 [Arachis hypogaea]|nr:uncharacterized protein DS421_16g550610 [Arachis hypogaea]